MSNITVLTKEQGKFVYVSHGDYNINYKISYDKEDGTFLVRKNSMIVGIFPKENTICALIDDV